jgi:hypothetical protein
MAISIEIDEPSGVAVISCSGVLRLEDARWAAEELWSTPDWPGRAAVWEFRAAQFDLSPPEVRQIAAFILANQREEPPARVAFVTPRDVDFGMSRMFEIFRDDPRTSFRVFRDFDEAIIWARSFEPAAV